MNDSPPDPRLARTLDDAWATLALGVTDRDAPARHPVLATAGAAGADARLVVLRSADRAGARVTAHTDAASGKCADLAADPRATLLVWDATARLQIRLRVLARLRPGTAAEWAAIPEPSRRAYGGAPPPGHPLARPEDHDATPDPDRFRVIDMDVREVETLRLADPHERALFPSADGFRGRWIAP